MKQDSTEERERVSGLVGLYLRLPKVQVGTETVTFPGTKVEPTLRPSGGVWRGLLVISQSQYNNCEQGRGTC